MIMRITYGQNLRRGDGRLLRRVEDGLCVSECHTRRQTGRCPDNVVLALDILCVDPQHQRRGAGTLFLEYGVQIADELGVEV